jgi:hypothetical protein
MLRRIQEALSQDKEILASKSLSLEKSQISLATLIMALFYDLATEKDFKIPTQPERRERALRDLIKKRQKPIALFIDDAHDLHSKTLIGLKRLIEVIRDSGGMLSVVLAGHPKLEERSAPVLVGGFGQEAQGAFNGFDPIKVEDFKDKFACLNFGKIQDVIEDGKQRLTDCTNGFGKFSLLGFQVAIEQ